MSKYIKCQPDNYIVVVQNLPLKCVLGVRFRTTHFPAQYQNEMLRAMFVELVIVMWGPSKSRPTGTRKHIFRQQSTAYPVENWWTQIGPNPCLLPYPKKLFMYFLFVYICLHMFNSHQGLLCYLRLLGSCAFWALDLGLCDLLVTLRMQLSA